MSINWMSIDRMSIDRNLMKSIGWDDYRFAISWASWAFRWDGIHDRDQTCRKIKNEDPDISVSYWPIRSSDFEERRSKSVRIARILDIKVYYQPHTKYELAALIGQNLTTERNTHCLIADSTELSIQMGLHKSLQLILLDCNRFWLQPSPNEIWIDRVMGNAESVRNKEWEPGCIGGWY